MHVFQSLSESKWALYLFKIEQNTVRWKLKYSGLNQVQNHRRKYIRTRWLWSHYSTPGMDLGGEDEQENLNAKRFTLTQFNISPLH